MSAFQCLVKERVFIVFLNERVKNEKERFCQCFAVETFFSLKKICYKNYTRNEGTYHDIYAFMTRVVNILN